jgi:hypothetical protein
MAAFDQEFYHADAFLDYLAWIGKLVARIMLLLRGDPLGQFTSAHALDLGTHLEIA